MIIDEFCSTIKKIEYIVVANWTPLSGMRQLTLIISDEHMNYSIQSRQ